MQLAKPLNLNPRQLAETLRAALLAGSGPAGKVFSAALAVERAGFDEAEEQARELGVTPLDLAQAYLQAVVFADEVMAAW